MLGYYLIFVFTFYHVKIEPVKKNDFKVSKDSTQVCLPGVICLGSLLYFNSVAAFESEVYLIFFGFNVINVESDVEKYCLEISGCKFVILFVLQVLGT